MGILAQEMTRLARQAGGSHKAAHDRIALAQRFYGRLVMAQNVRARRVEHLKVRHIEGYIWERLAQGISKRSLQSEMVAVRCILKQTERDKLAQSERLNNRSLRLSGASRKDTKQAITAEYYHHAVETTRVRDSGVAAAPKLSRLMGLRLQEAVQSVQSPKTWRQAMERGELRLTVVFGTKGGHPRETVILDAVAIRKALDNASAVAKNRHDRLIDKSDLRSTMKYWHSQASCIGLMGVYSPHSLRYVWAQEAIHHYPAQGFSEKKALAITAMDLGYGDGRGRYVAQVYGRRGDTD